MIYIITLLMMAAGYYSLTYGISLWKDNNKLGGFGAVFIAVAGTIAPIVVMYIKR